MMNQFADPYLPEEEETEEQINECKKQILANVIGKGLEEIEKNRRDWLMQNFPVFYLDPRTGQPVYSSYLEYMHAQRRAKQELERQMNAWLRRLGEKAAKTAQRATTMSWSKIRKLVWERDEGICQVCGLEIEPKYYECGHIIDRICGGSDRPSNLVVMCISCNRLKPPTRTREEYLEWARTGGFGAILNSIYQLYLSRGAHSPLKGSI